MKYYTVYRKIADNVVGTDIIEILKDPDFCRGHDVPFKSFIRLGVAPFLPWLTRYEHTAIAQASLLSRLDNIPYYVGYGDVSFTEILKNTMEG